MPVVQQNLPNSFQGLDLLTNALLEINAVPPGDAISAANASYALSKANRMLDQWAAQKRFVYAVSLGTPFGLVPGLNPHTIGPTNATFPLALRPVKIENANLIINTNPVVKRPLYVIQGTEGEKWYAAKRVPSIQTSVPMELYYQPDWPNGSLFFYPVPNTAYQVELGTWSLLGSIVLNQTYSFPPGYEEAITLSLAEAMWSAFHQGEPCDPELKQNAANARAIIASVNLEPPHMATHDAGCPRSGRKAGRRGDFNYLDGSRA